VGTFKAETMEGQAAKKFSAAWNIQKEGKNQHEEWKQMQPVSDVGY
jgi:hypothetical protein